MASTDAGYRNLRMVLPTEVPSAPSQQQMCEETSDAFVEPAAETHEEQPPLPDARGHCGVAPALLGITGGLLLVAAAVLCIVGDGDGQHGLRGGVSSGSAAGGQHGKAPLRILAAGGGSAIAGAWMACGGFFGSCWATIGHLTAGVAMHAVGPSLLYGPGSSSARLNCATVAEVLSTSSLGVAIALGVVGSVGETSSEVVATPAAVSSRTSGSPL
eukprot:CAMPEP_0176296746 /NCGR_PEP_ID=MMETSP0121_2-20121125/58360_1 /TAXON_ID=160619 /ORGANISM="Kryptoperidinium foliaceum, Strain CCMP 1326" /LENGTH=214 /DNA_ID=CAMNT_0017637903 /DNA_START=60 /DNA_END=705 /DNA_ORIENTATION=-